VTPRIAEKTQVGITQQRYTSNQPAETRKQGGVDLFFIEEAFKS
jgi:hypothetical protein